MFKRYVCLAGFTLFVLPACGQGASDGPVAERSEASAGSSSAPAAPPSSPEEVAWQTAALWAESAPLGDRELCPADVTALEDSLRKRFATFNRDDVFVWEPFSAVAYSEEIGATGYVCRWKGETDFDPAAGVTVAFSPQISTAWIEARSSGVNGPNDFQTPWLPLYDGEYSRALSNGSCSVAWVTRGAYVTISAVLYDTISENDYVAFCDEGFELLMIENLDSVLTPTDG